MSRHPNGRRPPPPGRHPHSGSSGKPGPAVTKIVIAIFGVPFLAFLSAVAYVIHGHVSS